jgi:competence protein ComEC
VSQKSTLPFFFLVFILGILTLYLRLTIWFYPLLFLALLLGFLCIRIWGSLAVFILVLAFLFAFFRTQATQQAVLPIFLEKNKEVPVSGVITGDPEWYEKAVYFYVVNGQQKIWVKVPFLPNETKQTEKLLHDGNRLLCEGITGITESPYHTSLTQIEYLRRKNVCGYLIVQTEDIKILKKGNQGLFRQKIDLFRLYMTTNLQRVFKKNIDFSNFLIAITLGQVSGQSYWSEQYSQIGITHMMAISGTNFIILSMFFLFILTLLSIKTPVKEIMTILLLLFYLALIGFIPGAFRSFIMISLVLLAAIFKKLYNPLTAICLAGFILLSWNPWLLFDIGFQLSFLGVIAFLLPVTFFSKGMVANSITSLLISYQFHLVSLSSMLANMLLFPFLPIFYIAGILWGVGAPVFGWMVFLITQTWILFQWTTAKLAMLIFGYRYVPMFPIVFLVLYYGVIFLVLFLQYYLVNPSRKDNYKKVMIILVVLPFLILAYPRTLDKKVRIEFVDVGQGDSCLIQIPDGTVILIDGGKTDSGILNLLKKRGINRIDLVILSHYHDDHYGGILDVLRNIPTVSRFILPATQSIDQGLFVSLYQKLPKKPLRVETICGRKRIVLSNKCQIDFYSPYCDLTKLDPENENNRSIVLRFQYGNTSVLFPGDIEEPAENLLVKEFGEDLFSTILKLPHHGSKTSASPSFLATVNPQEVIISSGLLKIFNHPSPSTLLRLQNLGYPYHITRETGDIQFYSNGRNLTQFYEENP